MNSYVIYVPQNVAWIEADEVGINDDGMLTFIKNKQVIGVFKEWHGWSICDPNSKQLITCAC